MRHRVRQPVKGESFEMLCRSPREALTESTRADGKTGASVVLILAFKTNSDLALPPHSLDCCASQGAGGMQGR